MAPPVSPALFALPLLGLLAAGCGHVGKPTVIYLARHGQTDWNHKARLQGDPDLDPVGYINRLALWRLLRDRPLHSVYTSERLRTQRTAELVARQHGLKLLTRAALNEIESGVFEGICFSQLEPERTSPRDRTCEVAPRGSNPEATLSWARPVFRQAWADRVDGKFPLGQSLRELARQTARFVDELSHGLTWREVLVVGHGVVNRALLHHLMRWPLASVTGLRQENDQVYRVEQAERAPRLFLHTPGVGWRPCQSTPPRPGQRHLDCHPRPARPVEQRQPAPEAASRPAS